jgi:hypothetical protein
MHEKQAAHTEKSIREQFEPLSIQKRSAALFSNTYLLGPIPVILIQILIPFLPDRFFGKNGLLVAPQAQ